MKIYHEVRQYADNYKVWHSMYRNIGFSAHWHNEVELIYAHGGTIRIIVENIEYALNEGDLLICGSHSIHFSDYGSLNNQLEFILFDPDLIISDGSAWHKAIHLTAAQLREYGLADTVSGLFKNVPQELAERKPYYKNIVTSYISSAWYNMLRFFPTESDNINHEGIKKFENALAYIHTHFREPISLKDVSDSMNFTPTYFSYLFHKVIGISFVQYLQTLRLQEAASLMQKSGYKIIDAALDAGFSNMRNFNRIFCKYTGKTPSAFLKENQGEPLTIMLSYTTSDTLPVENDSYVIITENSSPTPKSPN